MGSELSVNIGGVAASLKGDTLTVNNSGTKLVKMHLDEDDYGKLLLSVGDGDKAQTNTFNTKDIKHIKYRGGNQAEKLIVRVPNYIRDHKIDVDVKLEGGADEVFIGADSATLDLGSGEKKSIKTGIWSEISVTGKVNNSEVNIDKWEVYPAIKFNISGNNNKFNFCKSYEDFQPIFNGSGNDVFIEAGETVTATFKGSSNALRIEDASSEYRGRKSRAVNFNGGSNTATIGVGAAYIWEPGKAAKLYPFEYKVNSVGENNRIDFAANMEGYIEHSIVDVRKPLRVYSKAVLGDLNQKLPTKGALNIKDNPRFNGFSYGEEDSEPFLLVK